HRQALPAGQHQLSHQVRLEAPPFAVTRERELVAEDVPLCGADEKFRFLLFSIGDAGHRSDGLIEPKPFGAQARGVKEVRSSCILAALVLRSSPEVIQAEDTTGTAILCTSLGDSHQEGLIGSLLLICEVEKATNRGSFPRMDREEDWLPHGFADEIGQPYRSDDSIAGAEGEQALAPRLEFE